MGDQKTTQAMIVDQSEINKSQVVERFALFDSDGVPVATDDLVTATPPTGADVVLTGMVAGEAAAVAATDTVNEAIAKLQAQVDALAPS
jgi:hypothetical protein